MLLVRLQVLASNPSAGPSTIQFKSVQAYQLQGLKNVYHVAWNENPMTHVEQLRARLKDEGVDVCGQTSHYMNLEFLQAIFDWVELQDLADRRRVNMISGKICDGGTDRSSADSEMLGDSYAKPDGHAQHKFLGRVEVDYSLSRDGRSCDAQAQLASLDQFFDSKGPEYSSWVADTPGVSMDAASVNFGEHQGLVALLRARPQGEHIFGEKSKAHQLELAASEAWKEIPYLAETWTAVTNKSIAHGNGSPKRLFSMRIFAEFLQEHMLAIPNLHGIRWQASLQKSALHTVRDFRAMAAHFHYFGKTHAVQSSLGNQMKKLFFDTPVSEFMGLQFGRRFEGQGLHTATVVAIEDLGEAKNDLEPAVIKVAYQDKYEEMMTKAQVIECVEAGYQAVLLASEIYQHYDAFTNAMYLLTTAFIADYRSVLTRLSLLIQRNGVSVLQINNKLDATLAELQTLLSVTGSTEASIRTSYDSDRELFKGIPIDSWEASRSQFRELKEAMISKLVSKLNARVRCVGPLNDARLIMFDFKAIPTGSDEVNVEARTSYGNNEVINFAKHFFKLWKDGRTADDIAAQLLTEWNTIKARYNALQGWQRRSNNDLRTTLYTLEEFPEWHRMTNIDCGLPPDDSECERFVSCMNRIKSKTRTRLAGKTLNMLMKISLNGPHPTDVDWMEILEVWRNNTTRGRYSASWKADMSSTVAQLSQAAQEVN